MKKLTFAILLLTLTLASCQDKYPDLEDGVYAEFITNKGTFVAKLNNEAAPLTVSNFVSLANGTNGMVDSLYKGKHFYDGLGFHRVIKEFMIQGGDPKNDGTGDPGYKFPDEIDESVTFDKKGLLAMANSGPNTNGSQFFVTLEETPWLNGRHTIFGEVVIGQDIVDLIGVTETENDKPTHPIIMESVNIIEKGKVKVPYFTEEMGKIEGERQEKKERINKISSDKAKELSALEEKADSLTSGVKIYFNEKGEGAQPKVGDKVFMNYAGYLKDGHMFDSNILERVEQYEIVNEMRKAAEQYVPMPAEYSEKAQFIPGFREGLLNMKVGDKATIFIPSHLAYGQRGIQDLIPPNSDLIFELHIVEIAD